MVSQGTERMRTQLTKESVAGENTLELALIGTLTTGQEGESAASNNEKEPAASANERVKVTKTGIEGDREGPASPHPVPITRWQRWSGSRT